MLYGEAVTTDLLQTSGATIHYKLRGTGPLLLISQSGEGDADRSDDLADRPTTSRSSRISRRSTATRA